MDLFRIVGMIVVAIGAFGLLVVLYQIIRGFVLACDFVMWQYYTTKRDFPELEFSIFTFFRGVIKNWIDMIGYTPDSFTCELKGNTWNGFGSWWKK